MLILTLALLAFQDVDEKRVAELLEKLRDDSLEVRDQAEADLMTMGEGIVPILEKAKKTADSETAARIARIVTEVTLARTWSKELVEEEPSAAYQRLEQAIQRHTLNPKQLSRVFVATLLHEKASDQLRQYLLNLAERHRLSDVWPAIVELIARGEDTQGYCVNFLQRTRLPREAAPALLKLLTKVRNSYQVQQLFEAALRLKPDRGEIDAAVLAVLESAGEDHQILSILRDDRAGLSFPVLLRAWKLGQTARAYVGPTILRRKPDGSEKELLAWLGSRENEEILLAADYVGRHRVVTAAQPLFEALRARPAGDAVVRPRLVAAFRALGAVDVVRGWIKEGAPSRPAVLSLAAELGLRELAPDLAALLADADPAVRREAARTLGVFRHEESAPKLEALMRDPSVPVRCEALRALGRIRGPAATSLVLEQLLGQEPDLQAAAVELVPAMDPDAALAALTTDANLGRPIVRYALASMIVSGGEAMLHRVMARVAGKVPAEELHSLVKLIQASRAK